MPVRTLARNLCPIWRALAFYLAKLARRRISSGEANQGIWRTKSKLETNQRSQSHDIWQPTKGGASGERRLSFSSKRGNLSRPERLPRPQIFGRRRKPPGSHLIVFQGILKGE